MVFYNKASSILFIASAIGAQVASGHRLPKDFDVEKFAVELKQLRVEAGQNNGNNGGGNGDASAGGDTVETFLDGHEFIPPNCDTTCRGPCPFINVMANHGFINRNGRNIPVFNIPALAPILFDFPKEMFTRPANQAIFDGQVDVGPNGEALLDIVRLWDRPGEERDISQVFPNPGLMWTEEALSKGPEEEFPVGQTEIFVEFRYNVDEGLLQQLLTLSEDGVTLTQAQHNQHLHHRLQESLQEDVFFRLSPDDIEIAATQYVLPCIILGEDVADFSFCPKASIEGLWRDFRFPEGFAPRSVRFPGEFVMADYQHDFSEFMETNEHAIEEVLNEPENKAKKSFKLRGHDSKVPMVL